MTHLLLSNPLAWLFLSWTIGAWLNDAIRKSRHYKRLENFNLFRSPNTYRAIGVLHIRRLIERTPLKKFNPQLQSLSAWDVQSLQEFRDVMTHAEICHWIGFIAMLAVTAIVAYRRMGAFLVFTFIILNVLGNAYLSLLQQYNKQRLDAAIRLRQQTQ